MICCKFSTRCTKNRIEFLTILYLLNCPLTWAVRFGCLVYSLLAYVCIDLLQYYTVFTEYARCCFCIQTNGAFLVCVFDIFFSPPKKEPTKFHVCQHQYNANFHLLMEMVSYSFWDDHFNFWTIPWKWYALKLICRICSTLVLFICICTLEMQQRYEIWEIYLQFHLSQYFVYITDNNKVMMFYDMS